MNAGLFEFARPFAVALVIALVIGFERERSHKPGTQSLGVGSFALLGILGTLSATLEPLALQIVVAAFAFGAILLGYWKSARERSNAILKSD